MKNTYEDMVNGEFANDRYGHSIIPSPLGGDSGFHVMEAKGAGNFSDNQGDWKFHLSVSPQDTPMAWDIVTQRLMETNYPQVAKVARPDTADRFADPNSIQAGKQITIYTDQRVPPEKYKELIQNIENDFKEHGINPGPRTNADRSIPGSDYASYRSEKGPDGKYIASQDLANLPRDTRYNAFGSSDPYSDFEIHTKPKHDITNNINQETKPTSMGGYSKLAFGKAAEWAGRVTDRVFGKTQSIRDADWQPEKVQGQNVAMLETSGMSHRQLLSFKEELGNNGVDFNTASNADGSRSSIAVSEPNSLNRLQNYVQTGSPETTLAESRIDNTTILGM